MTSNLMKTDTVLHATCDMFQVVRSNRLTIGLELWPIFDLCGEENRWKRRLLAELLLSFGKSGSQDSKKITEVLNLLADCMDDTQGEISGQKVISPSSLVFRDLEASCSSYSQMRSASGIITFHLK